MAVIDRFLKFAAHSGASDLHMCLAREPTLRLHGTLRKLSVPILRAQEVEDFLLEILNPEQRKLLEERKSIDFCYDLAGVGRFRSNIYRQRLGLAGTFRVLPSKVPTLAE